MIFPFCCFCIQQLHFGFGSGMFIHWLVQQHAHLERQGVSGCYLAKNSIKIKQRYWWVNQRNRTLSLIVNSSQTVNAWGVALGSICAFLKSSLSCVPACGHIIGSICRQLLPFQNKYLHCISLIVPVPIVASAGLGHVIVVVLMLYWLFCELFDDCREMLVNVERVLFILACMWLTVKLE